MKSFMKKRWFLFVILCVLCSQGFAQYQQEIRVENLLKTDTTVLGQKIAYPKTGDEEVTFSKVIIPIGKATGWHKHDVPVFAYVLQGNLTVELEDGSIRSFPQGSTFAEVVDTFHNGSNIGKEEVILLAIYLGQKNKALSIKR
jgi:quercetin dioxygenase-like cupin family protein